MEHRHGAQGTYDEASNGVKESDFGTKNDDAVIEKILLSGDLQESKVSNKQQPHTQSCIISLRGTVHTNCRSSMKLTFLF